MMLYKLHGEQVTFNESIAAWLSQVSVKYRHMQVTNNLKGWDVLNTKQVLQPKIINPNVIHDKTVGFLVWHKDSFWWPKHGDARCPNCISILSAGNYQYFNWKYCSDFIFLSEPMQDI